MVWRNLSSAKKGGLIGFIVSTLGFVVDLAINIYLLIIAGWDGISNTAGNSLGNLVGWVFIYGFLAVIISLVIWVFLALGLTAIGALVGWVIGKAKAGSQTNQINHTYTNGPFSK